MKNTLCLQKMLVLFLVLPASCDKRDIKGTVSPVVSLRSITDAPPSQKLNDCCLTFTLRNAAPKTESQIISFQAQTDILIGAFNQWFLTVEESTGLYVSPESNADIVFQFISPQKVAFKPDTLFTGWLPQVVETVSSISRNPDGTLILWLNADHYWTAAQLSRTFIYQIGAILGISISNDPESTMYPFMTQNPINNLDVAATSVMKQLYGGPSCDRWQPLEKLPFTVGGSYHTFSINQKGYLLLINENQLWEFTPEGIPQWKRKSPLIQPLPVQTAFSINAKGYALTPKALWEYNPATDRWREQAPAPPFSTDGKVLSMTASFPGNVLKERGYLFFSETQSMNTQLRCWEFDPTSSTWTQKRPYPLTPSASFEGATLSANTYKMGIMTIPGQPLVLQYNFHNDTWAGRLPFPGFQENQFPVFSWSLKYRTYLFTNGSQVWQYAYSDWSQKQTPPMVYKDVAFHFSLKCRGYVAAKNGSFWSYSP